MGGFTTLLMQCSSINYGIQLHYFFFSQNFKIWWLNIRILGNNLIDEVDFVKNTVYRIILNFFNLLIFRYGGYGKCYKALLW